MEELQDRHRSVRRGGDRPLGVAGQASGSKEKVARELPWLKGGSSTRLFFHFNFLFLINFRFVEKMQE